VIHSPSKLVPIQQAELFVAKAKEQGMTATLETKPRLEHGWPNMEKDVERFADWFD